MNNKRYRLAKYFEQFGLFDMLSRRKSPYFLVLNFHRLYRGSLSTSVDEGVFTHSEETFLRQLVWLKENFQLIDESSLIDSVEKNRPFEDRTALVTFDDGYSDNYEIAYPLLSELEIPAIFFVACNHINGHILPWWDQVAYMIKNSTVGQFDFCGVKVDLTNDRKKLNADIRSVLAIFKSSTTDKTEELLKELSDSSKSPIPGTQELHSEFMNWKQIKQLSDDGFSIGSHSMNHRVLAQLPSNEQKQELKESKRVLEDVIGTQVRSVAYPVGGHSSFTGETVSIARDCGYKLGFSFVYGTHTKRINDPYRIHRVTLSQDPLMAKAQSLIPGLFMFRQNMGT